MGQTPPPPPTPPTQPMPPTPPTQGGGAYGAAPPPPPTAPLAYPTGGTPPPGGPKRGFPALYAGLAGFGVILVLGLILYFVVLKPKPSPAVLPPAGPVSSPSIAPSSAPPPSPTTPTSPGPQSGGDIAVQAAFCTSVDTSDNSCVNPNDIQSASEPQFAIWIALGGAPAGTKVQVDLLEADTGQAVLDPHTWDLQGNTNCTSLDGDPRECVSLTVNGGPFEPVELEAVISVNGQPVDFGDPFILKLAIPD